jgi:hypothetical protein
MSVKACRVGEACCIEVGWSGRSERGRLSAIDETGAMYSNFGPRRQLDLVSLSAVLLSIAAGIAGVGLLLYRPLILQELIVPFVESTYSRDGVITEASIRQLDRWLRMMVPVAFVIACLSIGYALLWRYFSAHLQAEGSQQGDSTPPIRAFEFSCLAATLMLATIMRSHDGILTRSLTYDEIFTALKFVEVDSLWTTVSAYRTTNNHIAYSVLASIAQSVTRSDPRPRIHCCSLDLHSALLRWTSGFVGGPWLSTLSCPHDLEHNRTWVHGHDPFHNDIKLPILTVSEPRVVPRRRSVYRR